MRSLRKLFKAFLGTVVAYLAGTSVFPIMLNSFDAGTGSFENFLLLWALYMYASLWMLPIIFIACFFVVDFISGGKNKDGQVVSTHSLSTTIALTILTIAIGIIAVGGYIIYDRQSHNLI